MVPGGLFLFSSRVEGWTQLHELWGNREGSHLGRLGFGSSGSGLGQGTLSKVGMFALEVIIRAHLLHQFVVKTEEGDENAELTLDR